MIGEFWITKCTRRSVTPQSNQGQHRPAGSRQINLCVVSGDYTRLFEPTNAIGNGGGRQMDESGNLVEGGARIGLQDVQDAPIHVVQNRHHFPFMKEN